MPDLSQPTQVRFSARSVVRTFLQAIIPAVLFLGVVVPEIIQVVLEQSGDAMPEGVRGVLLGASAAVAAVAGGLAKVMALPKVEALLRSSRFTRWMAAEPRPVTVPADGHTYDVSPDAQPLIARHLYDDNDGQGGGSY
jgi:hypothetical protein